MDDALELFVDDILNQYAKSNKDDGLNFEEWKEWFCSLDGVDQMLMTPSQQDRYAKMS